jgi:protein-S-isoprenylcysteine O-methyltransferase
MGSSILLFGAVLVVLSQLLRSAAMKQAGMSFNHFIQTMKKDNHVLVTDGVYTYLRHPSYTGFFFWCIGTQILLGNFINTLVFSIASWHFFQRRITFEEESLCRIFGDEYPEYVSRSYLGIPFVWTQVSYPQRKNE